MSTTWGPALDAELAYRRERLAPRPRRAWWGRRRRTTAHPTAALPRPRAVPAEEQVDAGAHEYDRTARAA